MSDLSIDGHVFSVGGETEASLNVPVGISSWAGAMTLRVDHATAKKFGAHFGRNVRIDITFLEPVAPSVGDGDGDKTTG